MYVYIYIYMYMYRERERRGQVREAIGTSMAEAIESKSNVNTYVD